MKSFRLYLGERRYLTATGWGSLLAAVVTVGVVGYFGAAWFADVIAPGEAMLWPVAGTGLGAWGACGLAFRTLGYPLTALAPASDGRPPPPHPWLKHKP